ncbi:hypothetical protein Ddye_024198 [Dipteronia dyeriana]|uniref:Uncharacterized protein n=1 Tax=Dipteronia dyeriana TaxID=168575 RepID=A0AAD9WU79_9ROSI|nr:hypothetical protein Ddye_024198 [Dipteronia dyeriana]
MSNATHIKKLLRIVIFSKLYISEIWYFQKKHHEMFISCSMDEKFPETRTLCKQTCSWKRQTSLVDIHVLRRPIVELNQVQIPNSIQVKSLPQAQICVAYWSSECKSCNVAAV